MATQNIAKATLIGIMMFAATTPVLAAPALDTIPMSHDVRYSDLDLSTSHGQKRLETRIKAAVRLVCGDTANPSLVERDHIRLCKAQALANARRDADVAIARYENGASVAARRTVMAGN